MFCGDTALVDFSLITAFLATGKQLLTRHGFTFCDR